MSKLSNKKGFTLVELVVVIVIMGILVMLVVPRVSAFREAAQKGTCIGNMRTIQSTAGMYFMANPDKLLSGTGAAALSDFMGSGTDKYGALPKCPKFGYGYTDESGKGTWDDVKCPGGDASAGGHGKLSEVIDSASA
ncbi:MAG: prepilin-type N-terminal cleavage/methylation domain-containing protein [Clostridiales bacterium]|nr:prepilin-type N-terminal cleavage/methylation domain-containing protein [Clostridiales bacterium]